jgi:formylmethanofuran dehydrogenase subunit E
MKSLAYPVLLLACLLPAAAEQPPSAQIEAMLTSVAAIHGNAGVFAVAGYRMGDRALREFHQPRGSFALDVTHKTPLEVQYSCVADGWHAATGVSSGKLNLHIVQASPDQLATTIKDSKSGQALVFRLRPEFLKKYLNLPYDQQAEAAREVAAMPDEKIFTFEPAAGTKK